MTFAIWKAKYDIQLGEVSGQYADRPSIAYLPNGGYVVGWREANQLKFKIYDGAGNTDGVAYSIDTENTLGNNLDIQAIGTDGSFVVSWNAGAVTNGTLKARVFTLKNDGSYSGGDVRTITTNVTGASELASLSSKMDGGFASIYTKNNFIYLQMHAADGSYPTANVHMIHQGGSLVDYPSLTQIAANKYAFSYGEGDNIYFRTITFTNGVGNLGTLVNLGAGDRSQVVALKDANGAPNGQFAVIKSQGKNLVAGFYNQDGVRIGSANDIVITNDAYTFEGHFNVTAIRGGRIAVTYSDTTFTPRILLKVMDANGNSGNGNNDPLTLDGPNGFRQPTITEMADGRLSVAWEDWTRGQQDVSSAIVDPRLVKVTVQGTAKNDYYVGTEYNGDQLYGNDGNDTLLGGNGDDHLIGGAGGDRLVGGAGKDTASYADANAAVKVFLHKIADNTGYAAGDSYDGIEVIDGSTFHDLLEGDANDNQFWANDGNDTIKGFGGHDTLKGADGSDILFGGAGNDYFEGGTGHDYLTYEFSTAGVGVTVSLEDSSKNTNEAKGDTYIEIEGLTGTSWDDILIGRNTVGPNGEPIHDEIYGSGGNDLVIGGAGNDLLYGNDGNDTLQGGTGNDYMNAGAGFNYASYAGATAAVWADLENAAANKGEAAGDTYGLENGKITIQGLIGSKFDDTLTGGHGGDDLLIGGDGNDQLAGWDGSDTLDGGAGVDSLNGMGGFDYVSYQSSRMGVIVVMPSSGDEGSGKVGEDDFADIEGLIGSNFNDALTGNEFDNRLRGELGNDVLNGGAGNDTLEGGDGSDRYYVAAGDRIVEHAGQGTDTVVIAANFVLADKNDFANIENFILDVSTIASELSGNEDANALTGNDAANKLYGLGGNDVLSGLGGNDALYGGWGDDVIDGGTGIDRMEGGIGNDVYYINDLGDSVIEAAGQGIDTVYASVNFNMGAGTEVEFVYATGSANVQLTGSSFANAITGNAGANKIYGGSGNDKVYGELGNDMLYGQAGRDVFVFNTRLNKSTNVDKIYDFRYQDDSFQLDNKIFTKLGSGTESRPKKFNSDMFVNGKKAQDREDRIVYDKKTGSLYYDQDGTGSKAQVKIATIVNKAILKFDDFFVI
jgi:Ca2+-binding RTX toxin-like protein